MKKAFVIGISLLLGVALTGCSSTSSSKPAKQKEVWPSQSTLYKAEDVAQNLDTVQFGEKAQKDSYVRYSDILNFSEPTKYTGKAKNATGEVIQITKQKDGLRQFILDDSGANGDHIWVVESYTGKKIRTKDYLAVGLVVAGPAKYYNSDNKPVKAVMGFATSRSVLNTGEAGE